MIVFLYGPDGYRLRQDLDKIIEEYKKKNASGTSFSTIDFTEQTTDKIATLSDIIKTISFFDEKRLVVLSNSFSVGKELQELLKAWDISADKERILVFAEAASAAELQKKDKNLFKLLLQKPNLVKTFELLDAGDVEKWTKKEIEKRGISIEPEALRKLVSYIVGIPNKKEGLNPSIPWRIGQEIDKLFNYKISGTESSKNIITISDVELLVAPSVDLNIFETLDAFGNRNKAKALLLLHDHLESGTDPFYLFSMLVYQFRNLVKIKSLAKSAVPYASIVKKTGLNPYVVKKAYSQCDKFDLEELKQLFSRLSQLEILTKQGKEDMTDGLYNFVFSLT